MRGRAFVLASILAAACGDEPAPPTPDAPPAASAYEGTWLFTSMTFETPSGPMTVRRDGVAQAVRGDAVFTATGATTGALDLRQALLVEGLLVDEPTAFIAPIALDGTRWVLTQDDGLVVVFDTSLAGDALVLTLADDPRTTAPDPPSRVELDRVAPWSTTVVGPWELVSITLPSGTIVAGTCLEVAPDTWVMVEMDITFSGRLLFERVMTQTRYADAACTTPAEVQTSTQLGLAEEEDDAELRIWGLEAGESEYQAFTLAVAGEVVTLTRTACLPLPACEGSAPTEVVVRRPPSR